MRGFRLLGVLLVLLSATSVGSAKAEGRSILIAVTQPSIQDYQPEAKDGSPCRVLTVANPIRERGTAQVIVRDESDKIVAVKTLDDGTANAPMKDSFLRCNVLTDIAVPDSAFYVVYLDDYYITTVDASRLPMEESDRISMDYPNP